MKRISRRQFAKLAGGAALVPAAAVAIIAPDASPQAPQQTPAPPPEPRVKLTPEQEPRVKQSVERRDRQLASFRDRVLPYDLEPAFVFQAKPNSGTKK